MKTKSYLFIAVIGVFFSLLISGPVQAAEVLTVEDFKQNIVVEEHLIKLADNAIIMFDGSSSMGDMFTDTNTSKISILKESLQTRNSYFPNLGINFGLYEYAPKFKEVYAVQPYDRQRFADALNQLPSKAAGPTMLQRGLVKIEPVLQGLSGHTVVFLFTDGTYSDSENPVKKAQELADKYNVCFIMIGTTEASSIPGTTATFGTSKPSIGRDTTWVRAPRWRWTEQGIPTSVTAIRPIATISPRTSSNTPGTTARCGTSKPWTARETWSGSPRWRWTERAILISVTMIGTIGQAAT